MATCFVIQPFDRGRFDKRYRDIYEPALRDAGFDAYRVDEDPAVEVVITAIEEGISGADICLADVTTDNPNVWYELGYAFALKQPVVMTCSTERSDPFPFDIQHRRIIRYSTESQSDFTKLRSEVCKAAKTMLDEDDRIRRMAETQQIAPIEGLSQSELTILAILAGQTAVPNTVFATTHWQTRAERAGLTGVGFGMCVRRLLGKALVELDSASEGEESYGIALLTEAGWRFIEANESLFLIRREESEPEDEEIDDIPF